MATAGAQQRCYLRPVASSRIKALHAAELFRRFIKTTNCIQEASCRNSCQICTLGTHGRCLAPLSRLGIKALHTGSWRGAEIIAAKHVQVLAQYSRSKLRTFASHGIHTTPLFISGVKALNRRKHYRTTLATHHIEARVAQMLGGRRWQASALHRTSFTYMPVLNLLHLPNMPVLHLFDLTLMALLYLCQFSLMALLNGLHSRSAQL
mmetsp:Transcript_45192/g.79557  ORF Transcript_45192/g.79557 Transcript_45192/m.79557 type:complete len:207 (+) Transcript_45192:509-1129(+)